MTFTQFFGPTPPFPVRMSYMDGPQERMDVNAALIKEAMLDQIVRLWATVYMNKHWKNYSS